MPSSLAGRARHSLGRRRPHSRLRVEAQHAPRPVRVPETYGELTAPGRAPAISIVTPSYNQAKYLEHTIRSVAHQRYPRLEYIVQDGGSRDGSEAIIARHSSRLHHWASEPDEGQADAINRGFAHADGEILAYLNSDDVLLPGALAFVACYFAEHPEVDAIYAHRILINEAGREIGHWILPPHDDEVLRWQDFVPQETLFWRRQLWEKVGGSLDPEFTLALDWDLLLRFRAAQATIVRVPRFLGCFRLHAPQKTLSQIDTVGAAEFRRLRLRELGFNPSPEQLRRALAPYLRRHIALDLLYRARLVRY